MPLEVGNFRTGQENILACSGLDFFLLYLKFHDVGRVLDDLGYVRDMSRTDFTKNTFNNPYDTADEPVSLTRTNKTKRWRRKKLTYPEDTNAVVRTERWSIRLDHAEHSVQLPVDEKDDEKMMRIPKAFEVDLSLFLSRKKSHDTQNDGHDPSSGTSPGCKIGTKEVDKELSRGRAHRCGQFVEVDHMGSDVDESASDNSPSRCFVECDVAVKRNDTIERGTSKKGYEVAANREENEDHVNVKDKRCAPGNGYKGEIEFE